MNDQQPRRTSEQLKAMAIRDARDWPRVHHDLGSDADAGDLPEHPREAQRTGHDAVMRR